MWKKLIGYLRLDQGKGAQESKTAEESKTGAKPNTSRPEAELLLDLAGTNKAKQAAAIEELGLLRAEAAVPGLVQALASSDLAVVLASVEVLQKFPPELTLPLVLPTLDSPESWPPARTREVVVSYGVAAVQAIAARLPVASSLAKPHLLEMLGELAEDPDLNLIQEALSGEHRLAAIKAVIKAVDRVPEAARVFGEDLKVLLDDSEPLVRAQALEALYRLGPPEKLELVAQALLDEDKRVRCRAADLYNEEREVPQEIWQVIGRKQLEEEDRLAIEKLAKGI